MVISFCGPIGSYGKTTSCLNIGAALIRMRKRVLYIDLDFKSELTGFFTESVGDKYTIFDMFAKGVSIDQVIYHSEERRCDYIPAEPDMSFISLYYQPARLDGGYFKSEIDRIYEQYDYILIDCTQGADLYQIAGVLSSEMIIMPVGHEKYSLYEEYNDRIRLLIDKSDVHVKINRCFFLNAVEAPEYMDQLNAVGNDTRVYKTVMARDNCFEKMYVDRRKDAFDEFTDNVKSSYVKLVDEIEGWQKQ